MPVGKILSSAYWQKHYRKVPSIWQKLSDLLKVFEVADILT